MLALLILGYLTWLVLDLWGVRRESVPLLFRNLVSVLASALFLQILYGAFVAGSRAGYGYNTFPLMNGELIPEIAWQLSPLWQNLLDNNAMLQFLHRWLGASVLIISIALFVMSLRLNSVVVSRVTMLLLLAVLAQFLLGVFTLLNVVPIGLASLHQAGACIVLIVMVYLLYLVQPVSSRAMEV
jgi:cytochrome c oxidase assembly protein subunit 15